MVIYQPISNLKKVHNVYLGLGSNIEPRIKNLQEGVRLLQQQEQIQVRRISSLYRTSPRDDVAQQWYVNVVVHITTSLDPFSLLRLCQTIERTLGRSPSPTIRPRKIDIDILLYDHLTILTETLTIPHHRLHERAFVLIPLLELNNELIHSRYGTPLRLFLPFLERDQHVEKLSQSLDLP